MEEVFWPGEVLKADYDWNLPEEDHHWQEEGAGIDIVVEGQRPDVPIHCRHHLKVENGFKQKIIS